MTGNGSVLTVVILDHEHWDCTVAQLDEYRRQSPELFDRCRWIVVHNGTRDVTSGLFTEVKFAPAEVHVCENRGYGAGINFALTLTNSPYILVLNSDLLPEPGFLAHIFQAIQSGAIAERTAIVGFRLLNPDGSEQGTAGRFPTLFRTVTGLLRPRSKRKYLPMDTKQPTPVDWVTGACILVSKSFLDAVGTFDERFFMYYEDVDLCKRAWDAGWQVLYEPRAASRHFFPYHTRKLTYRMVFLARHGMLTYFLKHRPHWEFRVICWIARIECCFRERSAGWNKVRQMIDRFRTDPRRTTITAKDLPS